MAFGKTSQEKSSRFPDDTNIYYAKIRQKKEGKYLPSPVFEIKRKAEEKGKYVTVDEAAAFVSGNIIEIYNRKYKNAETGKETDQVAVVLEDKNETAHDVVYLNVNHDFLGWNIMNSLLALKSYEDVKISLYQSTPKDPGGKSYASVALRQYGELVRGAFNNDELPVVEKVEVEGVLIPKKGDRTKFFMTKIENLAPKFSGGRSSVKSEVTEKQATEPASTTAEEEVPF